MVTLGGTWLWEGSLKGALLGDSLYKPIWIRDGEGCWAIIRIGLIHAVPACHPSQDSQDIEDAGMTPADFGLFPG